MMMIAPDVTDNEVRRGLLTTVRVLPDVRLLDADTRRGIEGQDSLLAWVVASVCAAARVPVPLTLLDAHRSIPPGWWMSGDVMGITNARGMVSLIACGRDGAVLSYRSGCGVDHREVGIDASAWAVLAAHEAVHAAHHLLVGLGAAADALADPARQPGDEVEGFVQFVGLVHQRMTGQRLPDSYDASRWPLGVPRMLGWLEAVAVAVTPFAVPPAPKVRPFSEAEWLVAQGRSFAVDLRNLAAERAAAEAWRAAGEGAAP